MKTNNATPADMNQTIYNEIAKHAARAFKFVDIQPGKYNAAQISKALDKKTAKFDERAAAGALDDVVTVAVGSFECKFILGGAFTILEKIAKYWEITPAARAVFVREKEDAAPVAAFDVTPAAAAVCRAIDKKDSRENMRFVCIDAARRAAVASDGCILTVAALPSLATDAEHATTKFLVDPKIFKAGRVIIDANDNAANGANVAPLGGFRYPNWAPVFPAVYDTDAVTFDKKTAAALKKAVAAAAKFSDVTTDGNGRDCRTVTIYGEMYTDKITVRARHTETAKKNNTYEEVTIYRDYNVTMSATLQRSFAFTLNGPRFASFADFDKIYFPADMARPVTVAGKNAVSLLMPVCTPDDWQHPTTANYSYSRPRWAKEVKPVDDLLNVTPTPVALNATDDQEGSTPAAVADCQEDATPAAVDETTAAADIDVTPAAMDETPAPVAVVADIHESESTPAAADIDATNESTPADCQEDATPARVVWLQYFARVAAAVVFIILAVAGRNIDNATHDGPSFAEIGILKHATPATDNATPAAKTTHGANKAAKIESNTTPAAADIESTPAADCQEGTDESDAADVITDDQTDNATPAAVVADIESTDDQTDNATDESTGDQEGSTPAESTTGGDAPTSTPTATPAPAVFGLSPAACVFFPIL